MDGEVRGYDFPLQRSESGPRNHDGPSTLGSAVAAEAASPTAQKNRQITGQKSAPKNTPYLHGREKA